MLGPFTTFHGCANVDQRDHVIRFVVSFGGRLERTHSRENAINWAREAHLAGYKVHALGLNHEIVATNDPYHLIGMT